MSTTQAARHTLTIMSDTEIEIRRTFDAPARLVWEAWTTPEHMKKWYGPRVLTLTSCTIDLREGGGYHWVLAAPDGSEHHFRGEYRELVHPHRMVSTESYLLGGTWTTPLVNHVTMREHDGKTTVTNRVVYASVFDRDGHLNAGMEAGMAETFERLDAFLAELA